MPERWLRESRAGLLKSAQIGFRHPQVQELLGHSTMEMTMRYAHLAPEVKRDAVGLLDQPHATSPWQRPGSSGQSDP